MYQDVLGISTVGAGVIALPNTGGNTTITILAYLSIFVGAAILSTSFVRFIATKVSK